MIKFILIPYLIYVLCILLNIIKNLYYAKRYKGYYYKKYQEYQESQKYQEQNFRNGYQCQNNFYNVNIYYNIYQGGSPQNYYVNTDGTYPDYIGITEGSNYYNNTQEYMESDPRP